MTASTVHPEADVLRTTELEDATSAQNGRLAGPSTFVTRRRLVRFAAVGAMTLMLAGAMTGSADARPRSAAVSSVNGGVDFCYAVGGDPYIYESAGSISMTCAYADGSYDGFVSYYD